MPLTRSLFFNKPDIISNENSPNNEHKNQNDSTTKEECLNYTIEIHLMTFQSNLLFFLNLQQNTWKHM